MEAPIITLGNRPIWSIVLSTCFYLSTPANAQDVEFADDFNTSSIAYSTDVIGSTDPQSGISESNGRIRLAVVQNRIGIENNAFANLDIGSNTDLFRTVVSLNSDAIPREGARSLARVSGIFYNDLQDNGFDGDVYAEVNLVNRSDSALFAQVCTQRRDGNGSVERYPILNNGQSCQTFDLAPQFDVEYTIAIEVDRAQSLIIFSIDSEQIQAPIATGIFTTERAFKQVSAQILAGAGTSVVTVSRVQTAEFDDNFAVDGVPLFDRYDLSDSQEPNKEIAVENEELALSVSVLDGDIIDTTRARTTSITNYLEASLSLQSDSEIGLNGSAAASLVGTFYKDMPVELAVGVEGDVTARTGIEAKDDGSRRAVFCATRADNSDNSDRTELITSDSGENCGVFQLEPEFDQEYKFAIQYDPSKGSIRFSVNDQSEAFSISTDMTQPSVPLRAMEARAEGVESKASATADDFRTDPDARTFTERSLGIFPNTGSEPPQTGTGSSGGCSIVTANDRAKDPLLLITLLASTLILCVRRHGFVPIK